MSTMKTILNTTAIVSAFTFSTVQANDFFNVDSAQTHQKQPDTFDTSVHEGTTFWSYFNNGMSQQTPKRKKMTTFDESKHVGTTFWGYHNN